MKSTAYPNYNYENRQLPSLTPNKYQQEQIDRKFGMFIHFGINTFNNTEWSDGTLPTESYKPIAINADSWIKTAYEAGMNYVILITKHHDGFCMRNTHTTEYSVNYSPVKTDVVEEVAKACKKYNIKLGLYYSLWDRHEKCYNNNEEYVEYMGKQLEELLGGRYGEIAELWFDGAWDKACRDWQLDYLFFVCGIHICAVRMIPKFIHLMVKNIISLLSRQFAQKRNSVGFIRIFMSKNRLWMQMKL